MSSRILLADDHQIVREGVRALVERGGFEVIGEAADGWEAVRLARTRRPDVVLMDLSMPLLNGTEAAREILNHSPRLPIVLLTVHVEEHHVLAAFRAGIRGYVVKTQAGTELLAAVRDVLAGGTYVSPRVSHALVHACVAGESGPSDPLNLRERQVLQLVAEGKSTKDVAVVLDLTVKTAEYYRSRVMTKLAIHNVAGLVLYALRNGVVDLMLACCCALIPPLRSLGFRRLHL
jgi:two-component system response regulator NreC